VSLNKTDNTIVNIDCLITDNEVAWPEYGDLGLYSRFHAELYSVCEKVKNHKRLFHLWHYSKLPAKIDIALRNDGEGYGLPDCEYMVASDSKDKVVGWCGFSFSCERDSFNENAQNFNMFVNIEELYVLKKYRRLGVSNMFGYVLTEIICERIKQIINKIPLSKELCFYADFMSREGEIFFDNLVGNIEMMFESEEIDIDVNTDAGY